MNEIDIQKPVWVGSATLVVFLGTFLGWSIFSPLHSAAVASGEVSIESKRKTVQHLEGGIIKKIHAQEGQRVEEGDALIVLDNTDSQVNLSKVKNLYLNALAKEARLVAERDDHERIVPPLDFLREENLQFSDILNNQVSLFETRRSVFLAKRENILNKIRQLKKEKKTLKQILTIENKQLKLINKDIESNKLLTNKGFASQTELLRLQREETEIQNDMAKNEINTLRIDQSIVEAETEMSDLKLNRIKEIAEELREIRKEKVNYEKELIALNNILSRTVIKAPISGTIMDLQVFSEEGVIAPGQELLDIVPFDELMIVEAKVKPSDIEQIRQGMTAQIMLPALSMRKIKPLNGTLMTISRDSLKDKQTGMSYYLARIKLTDNIEKALKGYPLYPGMHAEVMLLSDPSTPMEYLIEPITSSLNRAFREH